MVGEPHGAELTGEGGRRGRWGRRGEAEPEQGAAARSVQLHAVTCAGTRVSSCPQVRGQQLQFMFLFVPLRRLLM